MIGSGRFDEKSESKVPPGNGQVVLGPFIQIPVKADLETDLVQTIPVLFPFSLSIRRVVIACGYVDLRKEIKELL